MFLVKIKDNFQDVIVEKIVKASSIEDVRIEEHEELLYYEELIFSNDQFILTVYPDEEEA